MHPHIQCRVLQLQRRPPRILDPRLHNGIPLRQPSACSCWHRSRVARPAHPPMARKRPSYLPARPAATVSPRESGRHPIWRECVGVLSRNKQTVWYVSKSLSNFMVSRSEDTRKRHHILHRSGLKAARLELLRSRARPSRPQGRNLLFETQVGHAE